MANEKLILTGKWRIHKEGDICTKHGKGEGFW